MHRECISLVAAALIVASSAGAATINVHIDPVAPGGATVAVATLRGRAVDAVHVRLVFPAGLSVRARDNGPPDCRLLCYDNYVATTSSPCVGAQVVWLPTGCDPHLDCDGVSFLDVPIGRIEPLPEGGDLLACTVDVDVDLPLGTYAVDCFADAADEQGDTVPTDCQAPEVHVTCLGDCNHDGRVSIGEVIVIRNIALGQAGTSACPVADYDGNDRMTINEVISARNAALFGCESPPTANAGTHEVISVQLH